MKRGDLRATGSIASQSEQTLLWSEHKTKQMTELLDQNGLRHSVYCEKLGRLSSCVKWMKQ